LVVKTYVEQWDSVRQEIIQNRDNLSAKSWKTKQKSMHFYTKAGV